MKPNPVLNEATIGRYFLDEFGEVWRHVSYCASPTASLERVDKPEIRRGGAVGAQIFDGFALLVPMAPKCPAAEPATEEET